jgi:hypothetical protein
MSEETTVVETEETTVETTEVSTDPAALAKQIAILNQENAKRRLNENNLTKKLEEIKKAELIAKETAAKENGEISGLYDGLKLEHETATARLTEMESALQKILDVEIGAIPEDKRVLLDHIDGAAAKLEFIATAKATNLFGTTGGPGVRETGEHSTDSLEAQHAQAMKDKNLPLAMSLKAQIRQKMKE